MFPTRMLTSTTLHRYPNWRTKMLRRPPTAVQLRPSDVTDMAALMKERNAAKGAKPDTSKDALLDKEQKERQDKAAKTRSERIAG